MALNGVKCYNISNIKGSAYSLPTLVRRIKMAFSKGYKFSEEHRKNLSKAHKGKIPWIKGKNHSEATKLKISKAAKGRIFSKETRRKLSEANKGKVSWIKGLKHSKESKRKMSLARRGKKNSNWGGGRTKVKGYILVYKPNHPYSGKRNRIFEHRLIMEKHLGRYLYPYETIHHINGIKDDNRIENLQLQPNGEHNTRVQKVYQENIKLKQRITKLELLLR